VKNKDFTVVSKDQISAKFYTWDPYSPENQTLKQNPNQSMRYYFQNNKTLIYELIPENMKDSFKLNNTNYTEHALNPYGFRCPEFKPNSAEYIFTGCSETFGSGGPIEESWAHILYTRLGKNKNFVNLGTPGAGWNEIIYNVVSYINEYGAPKYIFALLPNIEREPAFSNNHPRTGFFEFLFTRQNNSNFHFYNWHIKDNFFKPKFFYFKFNQKKYNNYSNLIKRRYDQMFILQNICNSLQIKLIWGSWQNNWTPLYRTFCSKKEIFPGFIDDIHFIGYDESRYIDKYDGHKPFEWHLQVSNKMFNKMNELL
jgi:hypothetical protein